MSIATGAKSGLKIGIESTFATEADLKYVMPVTSESLNHEVEPQKSEALLSKRGVSSIAPGSEGAGGSADFEAYPNSAGLLFYLALGKAEEESGDTKITPIGINEDLPSSTIEVNHSGSKTKYRGMVVDSLTFNGAVGTIPNFSVNFVGKEEIIGGGTDAGTLVQAGNDPYYFKELKVYKDDFSTLADDYSSIELTINNNLDTDDRRLDGTGKRKTVAAQGLEITGNVEIIFSATALAGEYAKYKNFDDAEISFILEKGDDEIKVHIPRLKFTEMPHDIGGADKITLNASFEAILPASGNIIEVIDETNSTGSY